ncbi:DUF6722 family protein [Parabacteroides hominis]|uniref:ABC transporter permease n=1 Tax=Parabacteroides hominis TaxID=2763057 RepID=A0ABR7DNH8_9BACT|nr:DUF6722 family protein [Parabacteroides hominis]MBC5633002.1 hypothetical protein [Parabacteroides hominis]MBD9167018.1 hypothetical protein [Parabacteroides johnsonii]
MKKKRNSRVQVLPIVREEGINVQKEFGKYLLDISKLVIGGAVITTALDLTANKNTLIIIAFCAAFIIGVGGFLVFTYKNKKL